MDEELVVGVPEEDADDWRWLSAQRRRKRLTL